MSGIAGFLDIDGVTAERAVTVARMSGALSRRPAIADVPWVDESAGTALAAGWAASQDGRWVVLLDGAIHNRADLRRRLEPTEWRSRSDAAVLAEAVARWGVERALQALDGQFAVALWDRLDRTLHLARDSMGERSLYWGRCGGTMLFGSQLKALAVHPRFDGEIDRDALATYMRLGYVPSPHTIHRHIGKLAPGTMLSIKGADQAVRAFWDAAERARTLVGRFPGGPAAAAERLNLMLRASVSLRLEVEPVVGVILSGDCPSALVAAIARALGTPSLTSVSLAIDGDDPAAHLAQRLDTDHHVVTPTDADLRAVLPDLTQAWDEPFADPAMPTMQLTARLASRHMNVALTGAGAEVLFGCDPLYRLLPAEWARMNDSPSWLRRLEHLIGRTAAPRSSAGLLGLHRSLWRGLPKPVPDCTGLVTVFDDPVRCPDLPDPVLTAMVADSLATLPDRRLVLSDGAAMAHGLELRSPFLDPAMAELAWSLSTAVTLDEAGAPACLREVLCRYLPPDAATAAAPAPDAALGRWLDGPLAEWAGDLLSPDRLRRRGLISPAAVARCQRERAKGRDRTAELWTVLMLEAWADSR